MVKAPPFRRCFEVVFRVCTFSGGVEATELRLALSASADYDESWRFVQKKAGQAVLDGKDVEERSFERIFSGFHGFVLEFFEGFLE